MSFNDFFNDNKKDSTPTYTNDEQSASSQYEDNSSAEQESQVSTGQDAQYGSYEQDDSQQYYEEEYTAQAQKEEPKQSDNSNKNKGIIGRVKGLFRDPEGEDEAEEEAEPTPKPLTQEQKEELQEKADTIKLPSHRFRNFLLKVLGVLILIGIVAFYLYFYRVYNDNSVESGYIEKVERSGFIFKTLEGTMYKLETMPNRDIQRTEFKISFDNDSLFEVAQKLQKTGKRVEVHYNEYKGTLIWRGNSNVIVTGIDEVIIPEDEMEVNFNN